MMKNVYFVQAGLNYGKSVYLPYATGCLAAYAWQDEIVKKEYSLAGFVYSREELDVAMNEIVDPFIVAFSCYNWTYEYNNALAKRVREIYPDCIIIYGGHNVPHDNSFLDALPFVDYLIHGEGEQPFCALLRAIAGSGSVGNINNISYRNGKVSVMTDFVYYESAENYPSPYLTGVFDKITAKNPDMVFCTVLETNRGCPYQCSYCNWCFSRKVKCFPMEKVKAEIEWMARHGVEYIFCADSNFGILERDLEISKWVVKIRQETGYPHIFGACYAKNSNDIVFEISKMFYDNKINKAATLAYQSLDAETLENVKRQNFSVEAFAEIAERYNSSGIPTYTEMILGLPGETYESFCKGLCNLIEAGQQSSLTVYYCQVYCNSDLGDPEYRKKFGIKTARMPMNHLHASSPRAEEITEYTEVVIETASMSREMMIKSILFCTCLQCFHHMGILKFFAVYLRQEMNIPYLSFYTQLLEFALESKDTLLNKIFTDFSRICADCTSGEWTYCNEKFGDIGWFLEEGAFLETVSDFDRFWREIPEFLDRFNIEPEIYEQLKKYQRFTVRMPDEETAEEDFHYDFYNYFINIFSFRYEPLERVNTHISVTIPEPVYNWEDYALKVVLYAKRRGDTVITNARKNVTVRHTK